MIGLMRLAWWREALERLDVGAAAEPLLRALMDTALPAGVTGAALAAIEDGWAALLDGEPDAATVARHGRERGGRLFACAAAILDANAANVGGATAAAGAGWALADLAHRHSSAAVRAEARAQARDALRAAPTYWSSPLRPLGALTVLAIRDAVAEQRDQGSPARTLRMLAMRLTGR